ncbi:hypothetical protein F5Y19DRAFT_437106 [Xylariaceae sp. FL1651]|nr:hypothetical protein F5Y19DRAFT_437106 [Xylariaceae sp. FL1651]
MPYRHHSRRYKASYYLCLRKPRFARLSRGQSRRLSFSSWYSDDEVRILVSRSWPWHTPECNEYPDFAPLKPMKSDGSSYGIPCLWILAETRSSDLLNGILGTNFQIH